jgi:hypothetical protein
MRNKKNMVSVKYFSLAELNEKVVFESNDSDHSSCLAHCEDDKKKDEEKMVRKTQYQYKSSGATYNGEWLGTVRNG